MISNTSAEVDGDTVDDPKPLGDCLEALVAAIYLDSGLNLDCVWKFLYPHLQHIIERYNSNSYTFNHMIFPCKQLAS